MAKLHPSSGTRAIGFANRHPATQTAGQGSDPPKLGASDASPVLIEGLGRAGATQQRFTKSPRSPHCSEESPQPLPPLFSCWVWRWQIQSIYEFRSIFTFDVLCIWSSIMSSITTRSRSRRLAAVQLSAPSNQLSSAQSSTSSHLSLSPSPNNSHPSSLVTIPPNSRLDGALSQIEELLESIVDSLADSEELTIPYRTARYGNASSSQSEDRQNDFVRFPGRTIQEAQRFGGYCS